MVFKNKIHVIIILLFSISYNSKAQTQSAIVNIDSVNVIFSGTLSLPYWLKTGQVIKPSEQVSSLSVLEFKVDSSTGSLLFYQVLNVKGRAVVPAKKAWKIEALTMTPNSGLISRPSIMSSPAKYTSPGSYQWVVPYGVYAICIEVWGGGGSGVASSAGIYGGGSGGAYGYECFSVTPGTTYTVQVGGIGGTSSVGSLISANGGRQGSTSGSVAGGTSTARFNITGGASPSSGMSGGAGANGGSGGFQSGIGCGSPGNAPGGGGSASAGCANPNTPGAAGQVIIHW
jgi:hypothetical protein